MLCLCTLSSIIWKHCFLLGKWSTLLWKRFLLLFVLSLFLMFRLESTVYYKMCSMQVPNWGRRSMDWGNWIFVPFKLLQLFCESFLLGFYLSKFYTCKANLSFLELILSIIKHQKIFLNTNIVFTTKPIRNTNFLNPF